MSNIKEKGKGVRVGEWKGRAPRSERPFTLLTVSPFTLVLVAALCVLASGCRMDMQDQPKYKTYRAGDQKFGVSGASVRPLVEGTVPRRGAGAEYRDSQDYLYTGKADAGQPGPGAQTGGSSGGVGAAVPSM